jgi:D-alanyl-D-alanine carboxypeptidase
MRIQCPSLVLVLLICSLPAGAQSEKVDAYIKAEMEKRHLPAVSLAVTKAGKVVKAKGYGYANLELKVPATEATVYKIGSISKQYLASGIMLLKEDGKVSLDDKISKYLEGTPATWSAITVRHVLTHTSGIPREAPGFDPVKIQPDAVVIATSYPLPLRFAPGEKWEYCNVGYFILGEIIHKVSGRPWPEFLQDRMFGPLKMTATGPTSMRALIPHRAGGYVWKDGAFENAATYLALRPSGAFLSDVRDLAKWEAALLSGSILKKATLDEMWTPVKLNDGSTHEYGLGWFVGAYKGHKEIQHGGSLPGFRAQMTRYPDDQITVIVLTNLDGATPSVLARGVAGFYIPGLGKGE